MVDTGSTADQRDADIRNQRTSQYTGKRFFTQVSQDQMLIILVQLVRAQFGLDAQAAASLAGLKQQMDLRIMPQRFIMSDPFHAIADRLPIYDVTRTESDRNMITLLHQFL